MVCQLGMGKSVGLMHVAREGVPASLLPEPVGGLQRDCSEATAHAVDEEVRAMLDEAYSGARTILREHRDELERAAASLLERETLDEAALRALLAHAGAPPRKPATT